MIVLLKFPYNLLFCTSKYKIFTHLHIYTSTHLHTRVELSAHYFTIHIFRSNFNNISLQADAEIVPVVAAEAAAEEGN